MSRKGNQYIDQDITEVKYEDVQKVIRTAGLNDLLEELGIYNKKTLVRIGHLLKMSTKNVKIVLKAVMLSRKYGFVRVHLRSYLGKKRVSCIEAWVVGGKSFHMHEAPPFINGISKHRFLKKIEDGFSERILRRKDKKRRRNSKITPKKKSEGTSTDDLRRAFAIPEPPNCELLEPTRRITISEESTAVQPSFDVDAHFAASVDIQMDSDLPNMLDVLPPPPPPATATATATATSTATATATFSEVL